MSDPIISHDSVAPPDSAFLLAFALGVKVFNYDRRRPESKLYAVCNSCVYID